MERSLQKQLCDQSNDRFRIEENYGAITSSSLGRMTARETKIKCYIEQKKNGERTYRPVKT